MNRPDSTGRFACDRVLPLVFWPELLAIVPGVKESSGAFRELTEIFGDLGLSLFTTCSHRQNDCHREDRFVLLKTRKGNS